MYVYRNIYCPPKHTQLGSTLVFLVSPRSEFDAKDKKKVFFVGVCSNFLGVSASLCMAAVAAASFCFCLPSSSAHQPFCTARLHARPSHPRWPSAPLSLARRCLCSPPRTFDHCSPAPRAPRYQPLAICRFPSIVLLAAAFALGIGHWDLPPTMAYRPSWQRESWCGSV